MKTAVDSSVLFDIVKGAPGAPAAQAALEAALSQGGACVCAVVVAELGVTLPASKTCETF
jgi:predicted nucleic acid-binding protein